MPLKVGRLYPNQSKSKTSNRINLKVKRQTESIQIENRKYRIWFRSIWIIFLSNREPQKPWLTTKITLSFYYIPIYIAQF
jgi:hypothetical protein